MPYINVRLSTEESTEIAQSVSASVLKHTEEILGKNPDVTSIAIDFVDSRLWSIGGVSNQNTFYLNIKVTEGTNTKNQKADYINAIYSDMEGILGNLNPASYILIDDIKGDSWGFEGQTQEYRYIKGKLL